MYYLKLIIIIYRFFFYFNKVEGIERRKVMREREGDNIKIRNVG